MKEKSEFEKIVPEDVEQFREISSKFMNVDTSDSATLKELTIDSWLLATRWSEIQSISSKIAQENGITKMDFQNWAYQKYRQLQELHITCRSWYKMSVEDERMLKGLEIT